MQQDLGEAASMHLLKGDSKPAEGQGSWPAEGNSSGPAEGSSSPAEGDSLWSPAWPA